MSSREEKPEKPKTSAQLLGSLGERTIPFSDEAERGVLSCILQDPVQRLDEARNQLPVDAFYHATNLIFYELLLEMGDKRMAIDPPLVTHFAREKKLLDKIGGPAGISELYAFMPIPSHWPYYVGILKNKRVQRRVISVCLESISAVQEVAQSAEAEEAATAGVLEVLQRDALAISLEREERGPVRIGVAAHEVMDATTKALESIHLGKGITGMGFGLADLDRMTNGLEPGDRFVIGAHSSTGKTALLMNVAVNLWKEHQAPGLIFSLDGMNITLARRVMADLADVDITEIRTGVGLFEKEHTKLKRMHAAQKIMGDMPIFLDDRPGLTIQQMCATARRFKKKHDIQWIAADFYQKIKCPSRRNDNDSVKELTDVSNIWMNLVLELGIGGIMLAQLNRDVKDKGRPTQHNVKGCSALFEDATKVVLMSRDDRPLDEVKREELDIPDKDRGAAPMLQLGERLIVADLAKNKDGPTGPVWTRLLGSRTRFSSFVPGKKIYNSTFNQEERAAERQQAAAPPPPARPDYSKGKAGGGGVRRKWNGKEFVEPGVEGDDLPLD